MKRLPVVGQSSEPGEDPLALVRGGRFARMFALLLAVFGLVWVGAKSVEARDTSGDIVKVHSELDGQRMAAAPPKPEVEDITPDRSAQGTAPPMPEVEDITPDRSAQGTAPPMPEVEDITPERRDDGDGYTIDRFGRKRTKSGALVLEEGEQEAGDVGLDADAKKKLADGGFFDPGAFDDAKTVKKKAYVHLMPGIPNEVFFAAGAVILLAVVRGVRAPWQARRSRATLAGGKLLALRADPKAVAGPGDEEPMVSARGAAPGGDRLLGGHRHAASSAARSRAATSRRC